MKCGVVFQPMHVPTGPEAFEEYLHGFDVVTDDATVVVNAACASTAAAILQDCLARGAQSVVLEYKDGVGSG